MLLGKSRAIVMRISPHCAAFAACIHDLGVNVEGVEVILRLYARLEALQRELAQSKETKRSIDEAPSEEPDINK